VSKGKLPDFYRNKLDECRQIGLIQKKQKRTYENVNDSDIESSINSNGNNNRKLPFFFVKYILLSIL
jgi:hypothetical protein